MAARHRAAKAAKFAEGGSAKKGPDFGGVMSEADSGDNGFKKGGKLKTGGIAKLQTGGIASGAAPAPRLDKARRGPTPMKRGGSAFSAAHDSSSMAKSKGSECSDAGSQGEKGED